MAPSRPESKSKSATGTNPGFPLAVKKESSADNRAIDREPSSERNPNPVMQIDWEGKVLSANKACRKIFKSWSTAKGGSVPAEIQRMILELCSRGSAEPLELKCGNRFYSFNVVPGKEEGIINLYGFDVTHFRRELDESKKSEERYRQMVETSGEGIVIVSPEGKLLFINQRFADMLGYEPKEILGKYSNRFIYDTKEKENIEHSRDLLRKGEMIQKEMKFRRKDGSALCTLYNATPLFDSNGKHTGNLAMHTDITDRIKIEESLKKSEQLYRAIGESIDYGIWICDAEGNNVYASQSYLDLVGITQEHCSKFGWIGTLHPDDAEKTEAAWKECSRTGAKWDIEHRFKGVDGKWHPILARGIPIRDDNGKIMMWAGINLDISSIKEAQEELRQSEARYRNLVRHAPAVIYEMDLKGTKFISVNDTMCKILGYSKEELMSIKPVDLLDEPGKLIFLERAERNIRGENIEKNIEYRIRRKDGELINTIITVGNVSLSAGMEPTVTVIAYDITERKRTEEALKESERRFKELVKRAPSAIYEVDFINRKFLSVNDAFCTLSGYSRDEALSMDIFRLLTDESKAVFLARINKCIEGARPEDSVEYEVVRKDGSIIDVVLNMAFNFDKDGKIIGAMVVGHDITERKRVENNLREAQAKLNIALENGNIGIWEWNLKTDEVFLDERMERMFDLKPGQFGETYNDFENLIHEEDQIHFQQASEKAITKGVPLDTIFRLKLTNNTIKYLKSKALLLNDEDGNPLKFSGVCIDVTGLKEGTEHLSLKLNEELLRSNKELERFAYVASHDLQEPLRMVSSFTQMLQLRYSDKLDEDAHDYIRYAVEGAKRMHDQINGLLEYSRINTRRRLFSRVDMNQVVIKVQSVLGERFRERNMNLTCDNLPDVIADEGQMEQLFQNLLSNAVKFSEPGKKIHIGYETHKDMYVFSVRDQGIGIEEQYFDKIFEMFQRLMPKDEYEGTGIGLSICKRIVERHHGRIWVESKPGEGSIFFFSLPCTI